jgi:hypothetical protein
MLNCTPLHSGVRGWLSPAEDGMYSGLYRSPIKDLEDITNDQSMYVSS